jgi:hypothetical protein
MLKSLKTGFSSILLVAIGIFFSGCGVAFYTLTTIPAGINAVNKISQFKSGDFSSINVERGPGVSIEKLKSLKKYSVCFCGALKKGSQSEDIKSLSRAFLENLMQEIHRVSTDTVLAEEELVKALSTNGSEELSDYLVAGRKLNLQSVFVIDKLVYRSDTGMITEFKMVVWDAEAPEKKRLLAIATGIFKKAHTIDEASALIAKVFFQSQDDAS